MSKPIGKSAAARPATPRRTPATKVAKDMAAKEIVAKDRAAKEMTAEDRAPKDTAATAEPRASKNILTAGIKALTHAHEEAVARQSRVFESLLGLGQRREAEKAAPPVAATTLDPFGFKKFEDVFDQRVARAMEHIGVPSAQAFADLQAEVEALRETVARLASSGRKR